MSTATLDRPARTSRRAAPVVREPYAVSYDRLSRFRRDENTPEITVGNDRQHEDNETHGHELGGIRERFTETGSASRFRTRERDRWLALLAEIRTGRVTHVLVWVLDRIVRDDADRVALISACREGGAVIVQSGTGTVVDPDDPDSVFLATVLGAVAVLEIEKMSKRIRRFKQARREAGLPHGGKRWFGYLDADEDGERRRNMVEDPIEGAIYRELVGRFLGGEALHSLAGWLSLNGVPTVSGGEWTAPSVRAILLNQRYAGLVVHKGDVIGPGRWDALIDEETNDAVRRKLNNPERRTNNGQNARVYLLAGLGVCATCGEDLRGRPLHKSTKTRDGGNYGDRAYACRTGRHAHRSVALVDAVVEAIVIERLSRTNFAGALVDDTGEDDARALREARRLVDVSLDELDEDRATGAISRDRYNRAAAKLERRRDELDDELGKLADKTTTPAAVLDGFLLDDDGASADERRAYALAAWQGAELGRRRALVELVCERVALRGGPGPFVPELVEVALRA
jgi:DNA invertase Pin-like site-specific DNA recombinase